MAFRASPLTVPAVTAFSFDGLTSSSLPLDVTEMGGSLTATNVAVGAGSLATLLNSPGILGGAYRLHSVSFINMVTAGSTATICDSTGILAIAQGTVGSPYCFLGGIVWAQALYVQSGNGGPTVRAVVTYDHIAIPTIS